VPGLKTKYNSYQPKQKQIIMVVITAVITLIVGALSCGNVSIAGVPIVDCSASGIGELVTAFLFALGGTVTAHQSTTYLK